MRITFAKATVIDGSTGSKQTSKGLFIFYPLPPEGGVGNFYNSELLYFL